jgi:hypothetical protein
MTTLMLLAVLGTGQAASDQTTSAANNAWLSDYGVALQRTKETGKPLLIVIDLPGNSAARIEQIRYSPGDSGDKAADKKAADKKAADEATDSASADLLKYYVVCRIDASSKYGQAVAQAFETTTLPYTAIIDKRAERILFSKAGQFTANEWTTTLTSYWRGERLVSYRPVVSQPVQAAFCST